MILVPRIIHSIWLGSEPLPELFRRYQQSWKDHHPQWSFAHWTEENLPPDLIRREIYETLRVPAERADMLRLEVLWRQGGVYVDADMKCLLPLDDLIDGHDFFVADLRPGRLNNAFIGSVAGHPILERAIAALAPRRFHGYDKYATGPMLFDRVVRASPGVKIFEPWVVYPASPLDLQRAYAHHTQARSWQDAPQLLKGAQVAEERLFLAQQQLLAVHAGLTDLLELPAGPARERRLRRLRAEITFHAAVPELQPRPGSSLPRRVVARIRSSRYWGWLKKLVAKRAVRPAIRLCNRIWRVTYATRTDRVMDRDEIPVLLNRRRLLGTGVEIGVKKGQYSDLILATWRGSRLISVDPWMEDAPERYVDRANVPQDQHDRFHEETRRRLARYGERSAIWRMTSEEAALRIADRSLDFVYIDARHDYASVMSDLTLWFDKMKPGGLFCGHDYVNGLLRQGEFGVKRAVDEFFGHRGLAVSVTRAQPTVEMFPSWIVEVPRPEETVRPPAPAPVAFVHLPKSAGGTATTMFSAAWSEDAVGNASNHLQDPGKAATRVARLGGRGKRVVVGHVPYGLYRAHLPADTRYVTFLREPIDRVLSHYYNHLWPKHPLYGNRPVPIDQEADTLEEALVEKRLPHLNNLATRFLCGLPSAFGDLPEGALDDAKANLRTFLLVGITERFDESIVLLQRRLGLGVVPYRNRHDGKQRPTAADIPAAQRALIAEHNRLDEELYVFAQGMLGDAIAAAGPGFAGDVEALRARSAVVNAVERLAVLEAREWLARALPAGATRSGEELLEQAEAAGLLRRRVHDAAKLLLVTIDRTARGEPWTRPES